MAQFHSVSRAFLEHQRKTNPSWSWRDQYPELSSFLASIDEDVLIKDNTEKFAMKLLGGKIKDFRGSREEKIFEKYKNVYISTNWQLRFILLCFRTRNL